MSDLADTRGIEAVLAAQTNYSNFFWSVNGQKNMFPAQFLDGFWRSLNTILFYFDPNFFLILQPPFSVGNLHKELDQKQYRSIKNRYISWYYILIYVCFFWHVSLLLTDVEGMDVSDYSVVENMIEAHLSSTQCQCWYHPVPACLMWQPIFVFTFSDCQVCLDFVRRATLSNPIGACLKFIGTKGIRPILEALDRCDWLQALGGLS